MAQALIAPPSQDFLQKTLSAALDEGVTAAASLNNVTGIQNLPGVFIVDRIDSNGIETPNKVEVVKFSGTSGSTVTTLTRGSAGTTDQDHAISAIVEFVPDVVWAQAVYDALTEVVVASTGALDTTKVVTPSATQTLTNKDLSSGTNTLPTSVVTLTGTQTLTNKRITKRVGTTASSATPTPDADSHDVYTITALAEAATVAAPSGTPTNGQGLILRIKDNGTARALSWNAIYRAIGTSLPTTTVLSKTLYLGFIYNSTDSRWDCIAIAQES